MNPGQRHPHREAPQQYLHPRDPDAYWRTAIAREMAEVEEANPGIFNPTQTPAERREALQVAR